MIEQMRKFDILSRYATDTASGRFVGPPAAQPGECVGNGPFALT